MSTRQILDNIVLVQEAVHSNKEKGMIIKMDMANTFDHGRHSFLFEVLKKFGGNEFFITMIQSYTSTPWLSPLVNGRPIGFFKLT